MRTDAERTLIAPVFVRQSWEFTIRDRLLGVVIVEREIATLAKLQSRVAKIAAETDRKLLRGDPIGQILWAVDFVLSARRRKSCGSDSIIAPLKTARCAQRADGALEENRGRDLRSDTCLP